MTYTRMRRWLPAAALALALPLAGCDLDELLTVEDPDTINEETTREPGFVDVLVTGAIGDFTAAYSGAGLDSYLTASALLTDEVFSSGTFTTRTATDRRLQQPISDGNMSDGPYQALQQARRALLKAGEAVADHPDRGTGHPSFARVSALQGFTLVTLGEGFCAHIPLGDDSGSFPVDGPPRTSAQLFEEAVPLFDNAGTDAARVGKGRALLNLGRWAEAASAVASVPTSFNYFLNHSENGANNTFWGLQSNGRYSISHREGGAQTGVPFRGGDGVDPAGADPRLPWFEDPAGGFDANIPLYVSLKYPNRTSDVVLASGIEARLIEAEAALNTGGDWLGILNDLRADVGGLMAAQIDDYSRWVANPSLDPLIDPGTPEARVDLLMEERALWLWGTGHRLGDLRRLVNVYGQNQADVYPGGGYHKGGDYGPDVVLPAHFDEVNNPMFDLSQCVVTSTAWN